MERSVTESMPKWIERFANGLAHLPRSRKRLLMLAADVIGIPVVLWTALTLRLGTFYSHVTGIEWVYATALLVCVPIFVRLGLYRAVIRFLGPKAILAVVVGVTSSVVLLSAILLVWPHRSIPISALPIYWAFALIYVGGSRFLVRGLLNFRWSNGTQRVAIYGAGGAGVQLASGTPAPPAP
jgi:FlaA1/EpsC-like NDP-sugar epimerase